MLVRGRRTRRGRKCWSPGSRRAERARRLRSRTRIRIPQRRARVRARGVVDVDLDVDLVGRRLLEFGLRVEFARGRAHDEAHEPAPFCGARADVRSRLS